MSGKKRKSNLKEDNKNLVKGKLEVVRSGMGFVLVEGQDKDILINPSVLGLPWTATRCG